MKNDYISRRDVQNILSKYYPDAGPTTEQILHNINRDVKNVPDADVVEVVHGKWEREQTKWRCSVCKVEDYYAYLWDDDTGDFTKLQDNYCPNCGAKMDGGDHNAVD